MGRTATPHSIKRGDRKAHGKGKLFSKVLGYQTKCDGCGKVEDHWPEGHAIEGWASVTFANENRFDYCPDCWAVMFCSLIKPA